MSSPSVAVDPTPAVGDPPDTTQKLPHPDDPRWLIKTVTSQRPWSIFSALLIAFTFLCNGLVPVVVGRMIDDAIAPGDSDRLLFWGAVLVGVFALNASAGWVGRYLLIRSTMRVGHALRTAVTDRIQHPRGMAGKKRSAGELLSIAGNDTQRVADAVMMTVMPVAEFASITYVGAVMLSMNVPLGIAVLVGGPVMVVIALRSAGPLRIRSGRRQQAMAAASATATDVVQGLRILKGLGAVSTVTRRYRGLSDEAYARTIAANATEARLSAITETTGSFYVIIIGVGAGVLALRGDLTVGQLITVVGLTQFIITPMTMLGKNIASKWASAQASAQRIRAVLSAPWQYPDDYETPLPDVPAGLTVVLGRAPERLTLLPRARAVVAPHDADLFEGSVGDNVHPMADVARAALHTAACEDIPGSPEREVGEHGRLLSGGQRQRVALARALARAADSTVDLLVLDDPTTAVDSVTEHTIAQRVAQDRSGRTTVVFSTAPAWQAVADRVVDDAQEVGL